MRIYIYHDRILEGASYLEPAAALARWQTENRRTANPLGGDSVRSEAFWDLAAHRASLPYPETLRRPLIAFSTNRSVTQRAQKTG